MLSRLAQLFTITLLTSLLSGCPKLYIAFEKYGGAFVAPVDGQEFVHLPNDSWGSNQNAMVYFYRPISRWSADELDAPSVYVDDHHYFNLRGGGYSWLEMAAGDRRVTMRRPLGLVLGFEGVGHFALDLIVDGDIHLKPGEVYYFRYSEVSPPPGSNPDLPEDDTFATGDLQLVSRDVAMKELVDTRFITPKPPLAKSDGGRSIVKVNKEDDYHNKLAELEIARAEELQQLKDDGYYRKPKWYWPLGGGPTKRLKTDLKIEQLDRDWEAYQDELERQRELEAAKHKKWWWPF